MISRFSRVASVAGMCLWVWFSTRAADASYQDWQFTSDVNPTLPTVASNTSGVATATMVVGISGAWYPDLVGFGTQTGLWDLGFQNPNDPGQGRVALSIPTPVAAGGNGYTDLALRVVQFVDGFFYTGELTFSIPGVKLSGRTIVEVPGGLPGRWVEDEFRWRLAPSQEQMFLSITGAVGGTVLDRIRVDTVSAVSEASTIVITSIEKRGEVLAIGWAGGLPPYEVYVTSNLLSNGLWQQVGQPILGTNAEIPLFGPVGFVRVRGLN